jgi:hypothetical protein
MNVAVCQGSEALSHGAKTLPALRLANTYPSRLPNGTAGHAFLTEVLYRDAGLTDPRSSSGQQSPRTSATSSPADVVIGGAAPTYV